MKRFSILLVLVAVSLVAAGTSALAGDRPFKSSGTGNVAGDLFASNFEARHLGQGSLFVGLFQPLDNYFLVPYSATLTSANGDELYFEFDVDVYPLDYHEDEAIWVVNATVTFTGGTGRFQAATGSADVMFVFDPYLQNFLFVIDGSIDY